jgi:hypothetical protein
LIGGLYETRDAHAPLSPGDGRQKCFLLPVPRADQSAKLVDNFISDEPYWLHATEELFIEFDAHFMPWKPAADALQLAADLLNDDSFPSTPAAIAERYGWEARRLNPAINYLKNRQLAGVRTAIGMRQWAAFHVEKTDATQRFVKSRT